MSQGTKETWRSSGTARKRWAFHVFLSFRGEDMRKTFTDHLYAALHRKGIKTFRDDEEIEKEEVVSLQLPKAIEESLSYIVILSQNYALSTWCLDELQKILESRKALGRHVFPIFYGVDRSHVRHQKGSFEKAMINHEQKFGKDNEKVRQWRAALKEIANISGWDTQNLLWSQEDIEHVLANTKGTELIQGIVLELPKPYEAQWHPEAFSKMCNLRLLILSNVLPSRGLNCLSSALKVLEWKGYPLKFLPLEVRLDELVDIKLQHSKIEQLWNGTQFFRKLKFIDLSQSKDLTKTPDFIGIPSLERLFLEGCVSLTEIHPSIAEHKKLIVLNLKDCKNLRSLPRKLEMNSLKDFVLSGCSNVRKLPEFGENMINLLVLDLEGTAISKLPDSLVCLTSLAVLNLRNCKNIVCLPSTIWDFKLLKSLNIFGCPKFSSLPKNVNENEALEEINVAGTAKREVPSSIVHFKKLKNMSLSGCKGSTSSNSWCLQVPFVKKFKFWKDQDSTGFRLPPSISHVTSLQKLNLSYCNLSVGLIPKDFGSYMPSLKDLNLRGNKFDNVAAGRSLLPFTNLTSLNILNLSDCNLCDESISNDLSHLSSLQQLNFMGNHFTNLPTDCLSHLKELQLLWINSCPNLQSLPQLPPNLLRLDASDNVSLADALSDPKHL